MPVMRRRLASRRSAEPRARSISGKREKPRGRLRDWPLSSDVMERLAVPDREPDALDILSFGNWGSLKFGHGKLEIVNAERLTGKKLPPGRLPFSPGNPDTVPEFGQSTPNTIPQPVAPFCSVRKASPNRAVAPDKVKVPRLHSNDTAFNRRSSPSGNSGSSGMPMACAISWTSKMP